MSPIHVTFPPLSKIVQLLDDIASSIKDSPVSYSDDIASSNKDNSVIQMTLPPLSKKIIDVRFVTSHKIWHVIFIQQVQIQDFHLFVIMSSCYGDIIYIH